MKKKSDNTASSFTVYHKLFLFGEWIQNNSYEFLSDAETEAKLMSKNSGKAKVIDNRTGDVVLLYRNSRRVV